MQTLEQLSNFVSRYMALFVILIAGISLFQPWTFIWTVPWITILLGVVMFGMGMTLRFADFKLVLQRPRDVFIGTVAQFGIMPLLAWALAHAFALPPELAAGVILVGTCPGGTSSNVMTYLARGDVALSVSMTMASTILAPIMTPLLTLWLAGQWIDIPAEKMMISIAQVVIAPIILGILINHFFERPVQKAIKILPLISVIAIVLIVGGVVSANAERIIETGALIMLVVICHNLLGYALGFLVAKALGMNMAKVKAVSIEVGMQNSGLATSLALLHFGAAAAIPGALFSVWHNISGSLAANYLSSRMKKFHSEKGLTNKGQPLLTISNFCTGIELMVEHVAQRLLVDLAVQLSKMLRQLNAFRTDALAVLTVAAARDAALFHQCIETFRCIELSERMQIEQQRLCRRRGPDEIRLRSDIRTRLEAAAAGHAVRQLIASLSCIGILDRRILNVPCAVHLNPAVNALEALKHN